MVIQEDFSSFWRAADVLLQSNPKPIRDLRVCLKVSSALCSPMFKILALLALAASSTLVLANEEPLNLDEAKIEEPSAAALSKLQLMGRVDLTSEFSPFGSESPQENNEFKNYHFHIFLKAQPSKKVSFMGEVVNKSFFDVGYDVNKLLSFHFGKILVPFGDTERFHHFYGGLQGYGYQGVMVPNIWAESGFNLLWTWDKVKLDTYMVNGFMAASTGQDPDLNKASDGTRQAAGLRVGARVLPKLKWLVSGYYTEWNDNSPLWLYGSDVILDYGVLTSNFRLSVGRAVADIRNGTSGHYLKAGDYVELASNLVPASELRLRYGTYIDNDKVESQDDVHNFNVGYLTRVDVLSFLLEYQWNFEAVNEVDNDVLRFMCALDF